jgi:two-component system, response regulator
VAISDVKSQFGTVVKSRRSRLGISQEVLAERAGLHRTYVSDVERGERNISLENIVKLARALEISVSQLLSSKDRRFPADPLADPPSADDLVEILFVEDRADDVAMTLEAFQSAGFTNRIHVVGDGAAALNFLFGTGEYAHRRPGDNPQLILLDLGLPKIGGLEVLRRIKADPRTSRIPVVVLTASKRDRDIATSQQLGAEAYIIKPVGFQNLSEVTPRLSMRWALVKPVLKCERA